MALQRGQRDDRQHDSEYDSADRAERTVLLIEDDADIRSALSALLLENGWDVISAPDGFDALSSIEQHRPSVVLLDWMMPVIGGSMFLSALRQEYGLSLPVVVISASTVSEQVVTNAGASALIRKPFDIDDVLDALNRLTLK